MKTTSSTSLLCDAADCRALGRHEPGCVDEDCRGCLARRAEDGKRLCAWHEERLGRDLATLPTLYVDLGLVLAGHPAAAAERVSGSKSGTGLVLNEPASDGRRAILATLSGWCRHVAAQRGITPPGAWRVEQLPEGFIGPAARYWAAVYTVPVMVAWLTRHTTWLAAQRDAATIAVQLHELAAGPARAAAYPAGNRSFAVAACPMDGGDAQPCPGVIWTLIRPQTGLLPSELACNWDEAHRWEARDWLRVLGPRLLSAGSTASPAAPAVELCGCACHGTGTAYAVCSVPGGCGSEGCDSTGRITRRPA